MNEGGLRKGTSEEGSDRGKDGREEANRGGRERRSHEGREGATEQGKATRGNEGARKGGPFNGGTLRRTLASRPIHYTMHTFKPTHSRSLPLRLR